nr:MYB family transcription factor [Gossypium hirsutum]
MTLGIEQLRSLCDKMDNKEALERAKLIQDARGYNSNTEGKKIDETNGSHLNGSVDSNGSILSSSSFEKKEKPWTKEEIELLRKGTQKYPNGTSRRWEVISEYIGTGRSVEEILKATKTVLLQKPDATKAFDSFLEKRKPAATIASPLSTREEVGVVSMPSRTENTTAKTSSPEDSGKTGSSPVDVVSGNGVSSSSEQDVWSAVQERALIQALKTFPKETSQRWERVATAVPGKTVNQCKKKFALLKENFRSKKSTA